MVDTWWQTGDRRHPDHAAAGATPTKPGSATLPLYGIEPVVVDEQGKEIQGNNGRRATFCLKRQLAGPDADDLGRSCALPRDLLPHLSWSLLHRRRLPARRDGYYWITGRVDDVLNVSGHRMGTAEVERRWSRIRRSPRRPSSASRTTSRAGHLRLRPLITPEFERGTPRSWSAPWVQDQEAIGAIATPDRSSHRRACQDPLGKIMRRILRKIAAGDVSDLGDVSTLADPAVVEKLVEAAAG